MFRKFFRKYLPTHKAVLRNRGIAQNGNLLKLPNLWHLNRQSVASSFSVGLLAELIPGPLQMIGGTQPAPLITMSGCFVVNLDWRRYTVASWGERQRRANGTSTT
jgi:uncharacterized protein (DUF2062 family)